MNARLPTDRLLDAIETGEYAGRDKVSWRACPYRETPIRAEWLRGWIIGFFGRAIRRHAGKSVELKDKYLAVFHEERQQPQPTHRRRAYRHFTAEDWELVEVARAMTPPLKWPVLGAMTGHKTESLRQRAQQKRIGLNKARAA